jgi:prepilin-type N-terminal cleavage/methylation domain-containing protein
VTKEHWQGFTLIEMSIVLVIIGLIVGGVLVGQDLINAAAVRAQITQIEKYNTAVNTFRGKYGAIPGDMNVAAAAQFGFTIGAGCAGALGERDGNGLVDWLTAGGQGAGQFGNERGLFWQDLTTPGLTSMIEGQFPNSGAAAVICGIGSIFPALTSTTLGQYVPSGKIGYSTYILIYSYNGANYFVLEALSGSLANGRPTASGSQFPVIAAYKIDAKVDDGLPTSGNVQAWYLGAASGVAPTLANNAASDTSSTCYNTTNNTYSIGYQGGVGVNCALAFMFQ